MSETRGKRQMGKGQRVKPRVTEHERELASLVDRRARAYRELQASGITNAERERLQAEVIAGEKALTEFWVLNEKRIAYKIHEQFIPIVERDGIAEPQSLAEFAKTWNKEVTEKQKFSEYAKTSRYQDALDILQQLYLDLPEKMLTYDATKGELISYLYKTAENAAMQFKRDREWEAKNVTDIEPFHETLADPTLETLGAEHDKGGPGEASLVPEEPEDKQNDELQGDLHGETPGSLAAWYELYSGQSYSPSDSLGHVADTDTQRSERARRLDARNVNGRSLEKGRASSLKELVKKGVISAGVDPSQALVNTASDEESLEVKYTWEIGHAVKQARATLSSFEQEVYGLRLIGYRTKDIAEQLDIDQELIERTLMQAYKMVVTFVTLCGYNARRLGLPGALLASIKQRITHRPLGAELTTNPGDEEAEEEIEQAKAARLAARRTKIAALAPKLRQPIELFLQGKGYSEIAKELGVSEATIRKRVERARREMGVPGRTGTTRVPAGMAHATTEHSRWVTRSRYRSIRYTQPLRSPVEPTVKQIA